MQQDLDGPSELEFQLEVDFPLSGEADMAFVYLRSGQSIYQAAD